jgi:hypothetical protein
VLLRQGELRLDAAWRTAAPVLKIAVPGYVPLEVEAGSDLHVFHLVKS